MNPFEASLDIGGLERCLFAAPVVTRYPAYGRHGFFLIVPGVLLYTTLSPKAFVLHIAPVWIISALIFGPMIWLQAAYFLIPGIVMGHLYKKERPPSGPS